MVRNSNSVNYITMNHLYCTDSSGYFYNSYWQAL